jgi:hypothetical protein
LSLTRGARTCTAPGYLTDRVTTAAV